jgi:hypothetical protein
MSWAGLVTNKGRAREGSWWTNSPASSHSEVHILHRFPAFPNAVQLLLLTMAPHVAWTPLLSASSSLSHITSPYCAFWVQFLNKLTCAQVLHSGPVGNPTQVICPKAGELEIEHLEGPGKVLIWGSHASEILRRNWR